MAKTQISRVSVEFERKKFFQKQFGEKTKFYYDLGNDIRNVCVLLLQKIEISDYCNYWSIWEGERLLRKLQNKPQPK